MTSFTVAKDKYLTKADLSACRDLIFKRVNDSMIKRSNLMTEGKIDFNQSTVISNDETRLLTLANQVSILIVDKVLTDIEKPGKILIGLTEKLEQTIEKLQDFNNFIKVLSTFIKIFGKVISGIASGTGAIAEIGGLINDFQELDKSI